MTIAVRDSQAGVTLIEILAVLAVVGVATGAAMMGLSNRGNGAEAEAVRLARSLSQGMDEALISGRPLALQWDEAGYTFGQPAAGEPMSAPDTWPAAVSATLGQRHDVGDAVAITPRGGDTPSAVVLPPSGAASEVIFDLRDRDSTWSVTFNGFTASSSGQDTP